VSKKNKKTIEKNIKTIKDQSLWIQNYKTLFMSITLAGFLFRIFLLILPPEYFYPYDHLTHYGWWRHSIEYGLLKDYGYNRSDYQFIYREPVDYYVESPTCGPDGKIYQPGEIIHIPPMEYKARPINYPPLTACIIHLMGLLHRMTDPKMKALTFTSWLIMELPVYMSDFLMALGCMFIVSHFKGKKSGLIAYILIWFCPGILLTGVLWGQMDSYFLASSIWCIYFALREKWPVSGLIYGISLMLKPQALITGPALAYFFFTRKNLKSLILFSLGTLLIIILISLPFTLTSGFAWIENSFISNFTELLPYSTLKAFNIWMIDLIISRDTSINRTIMGITKQTWGLLLLTIGLIISFIMCHKKYKNHPISLPMLIALIFAITFLFPTKVHERYIIYILPYLLISAFIESDYWIIFTGYSIIAVFEVTHHIWLKVAFNLINAQPSVLILLFLLSIASLSLFFHWIIKIGSNLYEKK